MKLYSVMFELTLIFSISYNKTTFVNHTINATESDVFRVDLALKVCKCAVVSYLDFGHEFRSQTLTKKKKKRYLFPIFFLYPKCPSKMLA